MNQEYVLYHMSVIKSVILVIEEEEYSIACLETSLFNIYGLVRRKEIRNSIMIYLCKQIFKILFLGNESIVDEERKIRKQGN